MFYQFNFSFLILLCCDVIDEGGVVVCLVVVDEEEKEKRRRKKGTRQTETSKMFASAMRPRRARDAHYFFDI